MSDATSITNHKTQQPEVEGWWTGTRGRKNKFTALFSGSALVLLAAISQIDIQPTPDDLEHADFLTSNFSETIEMAIGSPNTRHYVLPEHLKEAGDLYAEHLEAQSSIQARYNAGDHSASLAADDVANAQRLVDARTQFRAGADGSGSAEVIVEAIRCDTTDNENVFSCNLTRTEIGGFENLGGDLGSCERVTDRFTVQANLDGSIEYLSTKGAGYPSTINFDLETLDQRITDRLARHFVAVVTGDLVYYGAQENPQERDAFMAFSGCVVGGPR